MAYRYSRGGRKFDDITAENDAQGNTKIDFEEDYIGLVTSGSSTLVVSGSMVGVGTASPTETLTINGVESQVDQTMIKFTEDGSDRALIGVNTSNNILIENLFSNKHIVFKASDAGTSKEGLRLDGAVPEVVVNQNGASGENNTLVDFRVESDNNTHMLFVDGGNDRIGIGTDSPTSQLHIFNNSTDDLLFVETTEDSNSASPIIKLKRNSSSPADADYLGQFKFQGENSADQSVTYAKISGKIGSVVDGQEQGIIEVANVKNGSNTITARFKSDELQLLNSTNLSVDGEIEVSQYIRHMGDSNTHINFADDKIILKAGNKAMITMEEKDSAPHEVTINDGGNNIDFVVENNSGNSLLMTDASTSRVGINTNQPEAALDINSDSMRLRNSNAPSSADDFGHQGEIRWDANYIYICVATDTWKRVALSTW